MLCSSYCIINTVVIVSFSMNAGIAIVNDYFTAHKAQPACGNLPLAIAQHVAHVGEDRADGDG